MCYNIRKSGEGDVLDKMQLKIPHIHADNKPGMPLKCIRNDEMQHIGFTMIAFMLSAYSLTVSVS